MTRKDFQQLTEKRLKEATSLIQQGLYEGGYHLGGLAVECAIKACIAKQTRRFDFPEKARANKSYDHNLSELLKVAGLQVSLESRASATQEFAAKWKIVTEWKIESRYDVRVSKRDAEQFLLAITHSREGVLPWLRSLW